MDATMPGDVNPFFDPSAAGSKKPGKRLSKKNRKTTAEKGNSIAKRNTRKGQAKKINRDNNSADFQEWLWLKKNIKPRFIIPVFILALFILAPFELSESDIMPIEKISIQGTFKHLDNRLVEQGLQGYLGSGFFSLDIQSMQQRLSQIPWVKSVSLHRVWPGELRVSIDEKKPMARWDEKHLLSQQGRVFEAVALNFSSLPLVHGERGSSQQLLEKYRHLDIEFRARGLTISEMTEDSKGALKLLLNQKIVLKLGSDQAQQKIEQFLAIYYKVIEPQIDAIESIDFRYSNGFSIAWKKDYLEQQKKARDDKHV